MPFQTIRVSDTGESVTVTLNRPDALNAITDRMLEELYEALVRLAAEPAVRVVILTGEGRAFSAGVDLKALQGRSLSGGAVGDFLDLPARRLIEQIQTMSAVVIAVVNGFCFTGALEIALACDLVVAADEAVFADTHAKFGLRPTWGMSQRLPSAVGAARARLLSLTGRRFTGREAYEWGLAGVCVPRAALEETVAELAAEIAANSPGSLAAYKDLLRAHDRLGTVAGVEYEAATPYVIPDTDERLESFR